MRMRLTCLIILFILTIPLFSFATEPLSKKSNGVGYHVNKNFDVVPNTPESPTKVVLLTIDDGPSKYSNDMMSVLKKHNAKAIFFVNGLHDKGNPEIIKSMARAGFTVGNHTWSHTNLKKIKREETVQKEINDNSKLILEATGANPKFFRSPFGVGTPYVREIVKKEGMIYMNWSGAAKDWEKNTKDEKIFMKNIMTDLHPGEILLLHEHAWTSHYLDHLLTTLEEKGYTFIDPTLITY